MSPARFGRCPSVAVFTAVYRANDHSGARTAKQLGMARTTVTRYRRWLGLPAGPQGGEITGPRKRNRYARVKG